MYGSKWCRCKNRCAEEDTLCQKPNERGSCQLYAPGNELTIDEMSEKIYAGMTERERQTAAEYGAGDMEDRIREEAPGWGRSEIAECLGEINKLCGYAGDDE